MHENHASIVALHRLKTFFKKSADTFASTQYLMLRMSHDAVGISVEDEDHLIFLSLSSSYGDQPTTSMNNIETDDGKQLNALCGN